MKTIERATYREVPWKNGGGTTLEIAASSELNPLWRLSLAKIEQDGRFSDFSGYDRTIVVVEGLGCIFMSDDDNVRLDPMRPHTFSGDESVDCSLLTGPVSAFNAMTKRGAYEHRLQVRRGADIQPPADDALQFFYLLEGERAGDTLVGPLEPAHDPILGIEIIIRAIKA